MRFQISSVIALVAASPALADAPKVVTDISPVQSLVSMVMESVGTPDVLLENGASPHGYALRPSEARALQDAELLVWIGEGLTPWLEEARETLAADAISLELIEQEGTVTHDFRDAIVFSSDDHDDHDDHGHDDHDDHGHDDHDDHAHDDHGHDDEKHGEHAHDDHDEHDHDTEKHSEHEDHSGHDHASKDKDDHDHDHAHDHDHGSADPHAWLDPANAQLWLAAIASELAEIDPENAATYLENAEKWSADIDAKAQEVRSLLGEEPVTGFAVYHDAYQYFERAFDVQTMTSLSAADGAQPSAARAAVLGDAIQAGEVSCVFSEPQYADRALRSIADGSETRVAVIDPLGFELTPGPTLYGALLVDIATSVAECR